MAQQPQLLPPQNTHTHTLIHTLQTHTFKHCCLEIFKKTKAPCGAAVISATRQFCSDGVILNYCSRLPHQTVLSPIAITSCTFPMEWFPADSGLLSVPSNRGRRSCAVAARPEHRERTVNPFRWPLLCGSQSHRGLAHPQRVPFVTTRSPCARPF